MRRTGRYSRASRALVVVFAVAVGGQAAVPGVSASEGAAELLHQAARSLESGRLAEAEAAYRRALVADPWAPEGYVGLARAIADQGRRDEAVALLLRRAERWTGAGDYAPAEKLLAAAESLAPDSLEVLAELGRVRALDRRYLSAEGPLLEVFERGAADLRTMLYLGSALWENGRTERAEAVLRQAVEKSGGALPAVYQLGRLLLWLSRWQEAAALLRRCAADPSSGADVELDLARAIAGGGDVAATLEAYRQAAALLPEHSEARYGLAMALLRAGDRAAAERELEVYERLYREDQERVLRKRRQQAQIDLGRELLRRGRIDEAVAHLSALPESADSLAALAGALRVRQDPRGAVRALLQAVSLAPERQDLRALLNEARLEELEQP